MNVRLRVGVDELEETGTDETGAEGIGVKGVGVEGAGVDGARVEGAEAEGARVEEARVEGAEAEGARVEEARVEGAEVEGVGADGAGASELRFGGSAGSLSKLLVSGAFVAELTIELDGAEVVLVPTGSLKEDEGPAAGAEDDWSATGGAFDSTKRLKVLVLGGCWLIYNGGSCRGSLISVRTRPKEIIDEMEALTIQDLLEGAPL